MTSINYRDAAKKQYQKLNDWRGKILEERWKRRVNAIKKNQEDAR